MAINVEEFCAIIGSAGTVQAGSHCCPLPQSSSLELQMISLGFCKLCNPRENIERAVCDRRRHMNMQSAPGIKRVCAGFVSVNCLGQTLAAILTEASWTL